MGTEMVLCVRSDDVRFYKSFTLLKNDVASNHHLFELLDGAFLLPRDSVESNEEYKQIIVYIIVKNGDFVYRYVRSGGEGRLVELYSLGIGGHVNNEDMDQSDGDAFGAIEWGFLRELNEELYVLGAHKSRWIGVINDNSNPVGKVHLGIVMELDVNGDVVRIVDENLEHGMFDDVMSIRTNKDKYESWSQLLINEYLED